MLANFVAKPIDGIAMSITDRIAQIRHELPKGVNLLAVSKYHPVAAIREAYDAGQRCFGENRVQELLSKVPQLPADIEWHLIGHLQTNKVRSVLPYVSLIESVDSIRLLNTIEKESAQLGRITNVLLQVHIAQEDTKFGFVASELRSELESLDVSAYSHVRFCGLMGMATHTTNTVQIRHEFGLLRELFNELAASKLTITQHFTTLSMGMSEDYLLAIEAGSTQIRLGSTIFGERG